MQQVTMFPDGATVLWTLVNLILVLLIPAGMIYIVYALVRLNRRVKSLENRLNQSRK